MKMINTASLILTAVLTAERLSADTTLPKDSAALVEKLEVFVAEEQRKVDTAVEEKTNAVVKILQRHLERETKAGNLESALALKKKISEFSGVAFEGDAPVPKKEKSGEKSIPEDAVERSGHYYKVFDVPPKDWQAAQSKCEGMGGHLAIIETGSEKRFLARLAKEYSIVWIGAQGVYGEGWAWVDGSEFDEGPELKKGDVKSVLLQTSKISYEFHSPVGHFVKGFICEWSD